MAVNPTVVPAVYESDTDQVLSVLAGNAVRGAGNKEAAGRVNGVLMEGSILVAPDTARVAVGSVAALAARCLVTPADRAGVEAGCRTVAAKGMETL